VHRIRESEQAGQTVHQLMILRLVKGRIQIVRAEANAQSGMVLAARLESGPELASGRLVFLFEQSLEFGASSILPG
jgi:hypothetical protein